MTKNKRVTFQHVTQKQSKQNVSHFTQHNILIFTQNFVLYRIQTFLSQIKTNLKQVTPRLYGINKKKKFHFWLVYADNLSQSTRRHPLTYLVNALCGNNVKHMENFRIFQVEILSLQSTTNLHCLTVPYETDYSGSCPTCFLKLQYFSFN